MFVVWQVQYGGEVFRVSTWGESHGEGVGVVVDGAPAGISLPKKIYKNVSTEENRARRSIRRHAKKAIK